MKENCYHGLLLTPKPITLSETSCLPGYVCLAVLDTTITEQTCV